ncbi:TetR/AcrR family transcriptional regulator [Amycolatopsis sp. 195334CR]|uniref:TetR/AcrR family transcriptional regulator n=1 Tax=Amycolatopsis sp. 195334CR TaxID=2814588 RepID=UPI001A8DAB76|nr:TetR/AcrR family transcriptional regulator [Amycolatopsis sp. 195334CR]MBN6039207.1 TetR/AcrR family transcriptional regulator [Amycolatopsis sp. 195334CR]
METSPLRVYGGVAGGDRQAERRAQFVAAGFDLLGTEGTLTVRGACKAAGLAARYFYESFADRDALAAAVFDHVVAEIAETTLAAVQSAPDDAHTKVRAGLANIVRLVAEDPRRGRLLFSPKLTLAVLAERRAASARMFAGLLGTQARVFYGAAKDATLELDTEFLVGGLSQTLTAWLDGDLDFTEEQVIARCTAIFLLVSE